MLFTRSNNTVSLARRGFTLLEVLIASAILVVLSMITIPRLFNNDKREFELFVDRVADLLVIYAQRERLHTSPVGIRIDVDHRELQLVILSVDPTDPDAKSDWAIDRHVRPIRLPWSVHVEQIYLIADGENVDISRWPLTSAAGQRRPNIELTIEADAQSATLVLSSQAVVPRRLGQMAASLPVPIDLDDVGMDRENW